MRAVFTEMEIEELQKIEKELLKKIIQVCEKNNINYFLIGGSLLGAVRHKGFIPWDDDIDIGMTRENFEKFNLLGREFTEPYFLQNYKNDNSYPLTMTKVLDTSITLKEERIQNKNSRFGAYIDIFPLDKMPDNRILKRIQLYQYKLLNVQIESRLLWRNQTKFEEILTSTLNLLHQSTNKLVLKRTNILTRYVAKHYNYYNVSSQYGPDREMIEAESVENLIEVPFEDIFVKIPVKYDILLRRQYGDYMKLPDHAKQVPKHLEIN